MKKLSYILLTLLTLALIPSCRREPELHLHYDDNGDITLPVVELELNVYWDYVLNMGIDYDWQAEWLYGWDDIDKELFGELGYEEPTVFNLRRYHTGDLAYAPHTSVLSDQINGTRYRGHFDWGFWDVLAWNDIQTIDGVQSLVFDETETLEYVTARTNQTMVRTRYSAPLYTRAFYQPEALLAGYKQGIEINRNLEGFTYDAANDVWVMNIPLTLEPRTYIYLTQVILHHNNGRVASVDGEANLSGMARSVNINTGITGSDAITVHYNVRMKKGLPYYNPMDTVDIIGGRVQTFGMTGINANRVRSRAEDGTAYSVADGVRHYMDVNMQFNNGMDSTFVFDVTDQVRRRFKGGVLTVELDLDTVRIPTRSGGSGFDAVVVDYEDGGTHEFEM